MQRFFIVCENLFFLLHQRQATRRHSVAWQDSLRYRHPDLDQMPGLRRITICKNPLINDRGAELIAEALKDDLWVKGVVFVCFVFFFSTITVVRRTSKSCAALSNGP